MAPAAASTMRSACGRFRLWSAAPAGRRTRSLAQEPIMTTTRILVVDDDSLIRMDLRDLLQDQGYQVIAEAGDGMTAVHAARSMRPDLVIMDIRMSGEVDGIEAAATLHAEGIAPVLPLTPCGHG